MEETKSILTLSGLVELKHGLKWAKVYILLFKNVKKNKELKDFLSQSEQVLGKFFNLHNM